MNNQENELEDYSSTNGKKHPRSLKFLLILSSIYIVMTFSGTVQSLMNGPLTENQVEEETANLYGSVVELESKGIGQELTNMIEVMIDASVYINNEAFNLSNTLRLFELIIGAIAIVLMFQLKKIGFHIYVIYSLIPILTLYITLPQELIVNLSIIVLVLIGAFFSLLYGSNLKHMK